MIKEIKEYVRKKDSLFFLKENAINFNYRFF